MDFRELDEQGLTVCPECKKPYKPILKRPEGDIRPIQQIFPDAPAWQREQLITGLCSNKCWKNYIGATSPHSLRPLLKETYDNLRLFEETDPKKLANGSYRFIIMNGANSHTAFHTEAGLSRWLYDTGIKRSGCGLVGKYTKVSMAGTIEEFDAFAKTNHLRASIILDNGEYTRAHIKESKRGNTIYYLNPNYSREKFPYKHE